MIHPSHNELLELHFEEVAEERADALKAHVCNCDRCRAFIRELDSIDTALACGPEDGPPADGLERVLERVGHRTIAPERQADRLKAILPSLVAVVSGVTAIAGGGVLGAFAFFFVGALVTLAIAPVLILESQRSSS